LLPSPSFGGGATHGGTCLRSGDLLISISSMVRPAAVEDIPAVPDMAVIGEMTPVVKDRFPLAIEIQQHGEDVDLQDWPSAVITMLHLRLVASVNLLAGGTTE
jgi:hypothetical protein